MGNTWNRIRYNCKKYNWYSSIHLLCVTVILLVILGVKWISATPDAKADIKKSAVIYVVGARLVFVTGAILQVIRNVMDKTIQKQ